MIYEHTFCFLQCDDCGRPLVGAYAGPMTALRAAEKLGWITAGTDNHLHVCPDCAERRYEREQLRAGRGPAEAVSAGNLTLVGGGSVRTSRAVGLGPVAG
jgi:hypothetical protein